ncbi:MAG: HU family DNA-binding protein [Myxococcota bacterium]|nr:HU family DNA-binding protein [Myxococcota bacterium]
MTFKELRERVAARTGLPQATVDKVVRALLAEIQEAIIDGKRIPLPGVGTLERSWRPERVVRSIQSARRMPVDARWSPRFRPAKALKEGLLALTTQYYGDPAHQAAWAVAETLVGDLELYHSDQIPADLAGLDLEQVSARCERAFGESWTRAVESYRAKAKVDRDHLSAAAQRAWAS